MLEPPRLGRARPLTPVQRGVVRRLHAGEVLVDDRCGLRLEPSGAPVHRLTLRALVRDGVVVDPGVPLFNRQAGQLTAHGRTLLGDFRE